MKTPKTVQWNTPGVVKVEVADKYFLRPDEAALFLGVSKRTLSNLQKRRAISFSKLGRVVVFRRQDLITSVEKFRINAVGEPSAPKPTTITTRKRRAGRVDPPPSA